MRDELPLSDPHRADLDEVIRGAERAQDLTRQLLAFARKQTLQMRSLDLNRVILDVGRLLRRTLREDVAIVTHLTPILGTVEGDVRQLEQVILNLAINGQDAMPHGGTLTIETSEALLDEAYALGHEGVVPGTYVCMAISDMGIGMDKQTLARIFEPFFTTKGIGKGTGLGLATVYGIVKQHGGHINVYSEPDRGTSFKVYLPRQDVGIIQVAASQPVESVQGGIETVLLAEDQEQGAQADARDTQAQWLQRPRSARWPRGAGRL